MSARKGRLILMPNTLDFGVDDTLDLRDVLPQRADVTRSSLMACRHRVASLPSRNHVRPVSLK